MIAAAALALSAGGKNCRGGVAGAAAVVAMVGFARMMTLGVVLE